MSADIFDDTPCGLGEGPLWHPTRNQFFWFDIGAQKLLTRVGLDQRVWDFDESVSAATWISGDQLLLASETSFQLFTIETGETEYLAPLESEDPTTRSNDGRADPYGGFWIGTMGKTAQTGAGAIYRYYRGEVRKLFPKVTIPNAICFSPDGLFAYFTDTTGGIIMRQALDETDGWPVGQPEPFLDTRAFDWGPDGAVVDASGHLWNARWGGAGVACYAPDGTFVRSVELDAAHTTCPAFGGADMTTLFCTSATQGLSPENQEKYQHNGMTFAVPDVAKGQQEHQVIL